MSSDMFDKIKAHRDTFNAEKIREDERKALPSETQAKVAALEKERAEILAALGKDQERREKGDMKTEMRKASLEHPRPHYVPKFVSTWRNKAAIKSEAERNLRFKYAREKTEAVREVDQKIKDLTTPEREGRDKSPEAATPDFTKASSNDNWRTEEIKLAEKIEAEWEAEAERGGYNYDGTDREK